MKNYHQSAKGFTLIELLVVISVISFLSSVVFSALGNARMNARDTQRISDIRQMRIALELYRNANGTYPLLSPGWLKSTDGTWNTLQTALTPYMSKLPKDPINNGDPWVTSNYGYAYYFDPVGSPGMTTYDLVTQFENTSNSQRCQLKAWKFYAALGASWCGSYSPYVYTGDF